MAFCIRGATVCNENVKEEILDKTKELLLKIIETNSIKIEDISSVYFTATKDLDSVYPAVGAREIGITEAALMCFQEMYVKGSMKKCIRVSVTVENEKKQCNAIHIYLGEAKKLRPDLKQ